MSQDSKKQSSELNPGEVIYTSPRKSSQPPAAKPQSKKPKSKLPSFDIPLDQKRQINLNTSDSQAPQTRSVQDLKPNKPPALKGLERPIKSNLGLQPAVEPVKKVTAGASPTANSQESVSATNQLWPTPDLAAKLNTPPAVSPKPVDYSLGQPAPLSPPIPTPPASPAAVPPPPPIPTPPASPTETTVNQGANDLSPKITQAASVQKPTPPADFNQPVFSRDLPQPDLSQTYSDEALLTPVLKQSPKIAQMATPLATDPAKPTPVADDTSIITRNKASSLVKPQATRKPSYIVFTFITLFIIIGTLIGLLAIFWPKLENLVQSANNQRLGYFDAALFNSFQIDNQVMDIEIEEHLAAKDLSNLFNQDIKADHALARVAINNLSVQHRTDFFQPLIAANFNFKLSLQENNQQTDLSFLVSTVFTDNNQAYFKLESFCIDGCQNVKLDSRYTQRWSDLNALLQSDQQASLLPDNQSIILNYLAGLLRKYQLHQYLILWPFFNIEAAYQYQQLKQLLKESGAYRLDSNSCQTNLSQQFVCQMTINYNKLFWFYEKLYEQVFQVELPNYYLFLKDSQSVFSSNRFELIFSTEDDLPVALRVLNSKEDRSEMVTMRISYNKFDELNFNLKEARETLSLIEYHHQLLEAEQQLFVSQSV